MNNNLYAVTPGKKRGGCLSTIGWIFLILVGLGIFSIMSGNGNTNTPTFNSEGASRSNAVLLPTNTPRPRPTAIPTLTHAQIKESASRYKYEELARYPDRYQGKMVSLKGEVVQTMEGWGGTNLRVNVTRNEYDFWEDTVLVLWSDANVVDPELGRILEGDVINIYGRSMGLTSYESVLGATITLPEVEALYIER